MGKRRKVYVYNGDKHILTFASTTDAAKYYEVHQGTISNWCLGYRDNQLYSELTFTYTPREETQNVPEKKSLFRKLCDWLWG